MTMKTPEQIAAEVIGADALAGIGYQHDFEVAVRAIKTDRAQHTLSETDGLKLVVGTTRDATLDEVRSLIEGTGAMTWPWWGGFRQDGESFTFQHDGENSDEGAHDVTTTLTAAQILASAGELLSGATVTGDIRDAIQENLGYLDAAEADEVLQHALFGKSVFG